MRYGILGPLEVWDGRCSLEIPGRKERAILGLLLVEAGTVVSADRMIFELWGDQPPRSALQSLRSHVSRLRRSLGRADLVVTQRPGYRLDADSDQIDSHRFEALADKALRINSDPVAASQAATEALSLWRGPALADLDGFLFAENEARRLEERRLQTTEIRLKADLDLGNHSEIIPELTTMVSEHPFHEPFSAQLMLALYRAGRAGDALAVFADAEKALGEALGIGPSHDLRALERAIVLEDRALDRPTATPPHNLLASITSFIGREKDLDALAGSIQQSRLLTLTGPGGSGKSRLALEAASLVLDAYEDGVWRIELAPVRDPDAVPATVSDAFGEPASHATDPTESLVDYLKHRQLLLLIDNCEHLIEAAASLVSTVLTRCPGVSVLATSREPLRVAGETMWLVPPLGLPQLGSEPEVQEAADAFQLFKTRARDAAPGFTINDENRPQVVDVCRSLAGLPLAIELAASRIASFSPEQLLEKLAGGLGVLAGTSRTGLEHHRTMRAALYWSYQLLHPEHARVFRDLAVFRGGWTLADAEHVLEPPSGGGVGELSDVLADLVDRSLVERLRGRGLHYRMLEPIREFALEMFETSDTFQKVSAGHARRYLSLAREVDRALRGPDQLQWLHLMQDEHDNLRQAIRWAVDSENADLALQLVAASGWFWFMAGNWRESWTWLDEALAAAGDNYPIDRAAAIYKTGAIQVIRINYQMVLPLVREALEICREHDDRYGEAWCLHLIGYSDVAEPHEEDSHPLLQARAIFEKLGCEWETAWSDRYIGADMCQTGDPEKGLELQLRSISAFREMGDQWETAYGLHVIGLNLLHLADYGPTMAKPYWERSLRLAEDLGDRVWSAHAINGLANCSHLGDFGDPEPLYVEASERFRLIGDDNCLSAALGYLGELREQAGAGPEAAEHYGEALRVANRIQKKPGIAINYDRLARLALERGRVDEAARLFAAVERSLTAGQIHYLPSSTVVHDKVRRALTEPLPHGETLEDALPLALELAESIKDEALAATR